jgi:Cu(I)/Ag(I) efflux system membrane fusion protein
MRWEDSGHFRPVEVTVGIRSRDFVEIRSGLREGERAAAEGEFLLEADSSLDQVPAEPL